MIYGYVIRSNHEGKVNVLCSITDVCAAEEGGAQSMESIVSGPFQASQGNVSLFGIDLNRPAACRTVRLNRIEKARVEYYKIVLDGRTGEEGEGRPEMLPVAL